MLLSFGGQAPEPDIAQLAECHVHAGKKSKRQKQQSAADG
jgi:hypothetical protein